LKYRFDRDLVWHRAPAIDLSCYSLARFGDAARSGILPAAAAIDLTAILGLGIKRMTILSRPLKKSALKDAFPAATL